MAYSDGAAPGADIHLQTYVWYLQFVRDYRVTENGLRVITITDPQETVRLKGAQVHSFIRTLFNQ